MRLADLVQDERSRRGWSRKELARRAGVHPSVITRLEGGTRLGRADTVARVVNALGIDAVVAQDCLCEQQEDREVQRIDLGRVPLNERQALRRAINALVREFERSGGREG